MCKARPGSDGPSTGQTPSPRSGAGKSARGAPDGKPLFLDTPGTGTVATAGHKPPQNGPCPGQGSSLSGQGAAPRSLPGAAPTLPSERARGGSVSSSASRSELLFSTLLALLLELQPARQCGPRLPQPASTQLSLSQLTREPQGPSPQPRGKGGRAPRHGEPWDAAGKLVCGYGHMQPGVTPRMDGTAGLHCGILVTPCRKAEQARSKASGLSGSS